MENPINTTKIETQTREQVAAWLESVAESIRAEPGAPEYPMSILLLASALSDDASKLHWMTLCDIKAPDRPNGWGQALYMSRDLLTVLARLDHDYKLGMHMLPAVIAAHPLFQNRKAPRAPGRSVVELVDDAAAAKDGSNHD